MPKDKVKEARQKRDKVVAKLETIVQAAATEAREFTPEEHEARGRLTVEIKNAEDAVRVAEKARRAERKETAKTNKRQNGQGDGVVKVGNEPRTYERGNGQSYLKDLCVMGMGPGPMGSKYFQAVERLQRHAAENHVEAVAVDSKPESYRSAEERYFLAQSVEAINKREDNRGRKNYRDLSTASGAGGEFVPPLYLTTDWIAFLRAARPRADCQHHEDLPDGTMSINIPKVVSGTSVATQATENTAVSDTDLSTEYITFPVVTKAGQQLVSLQLLERSPIAFDQVTFGDLGKAYAQAVDVAVASGNGAGDVTGILNTAGINTITWTTASPGVQGFYGQIGQAKADIANKIFLPATHAFTTPTRWEWISAAFDTTERPLVVPTYQGPFNAVATGPDNAVAQGPVGARLSGLDVFEDANLPTTVNTDQDIVLVGRFDENWLLESPLVTRVLPQTYGNQLTVLLQVYGYIAFTAARYAVANSVISGTGLVYPPTFNS